MKRHFAILFSMIWYKSLKKENGSLRFRELDAGERLPRAHGDELIAWNRGRRASEKGA